jgi:hypothetical protein
MDPKDTGGRIGINQHPQQDADVPQQLAALGADV